MTRKAAFQVTGMVCTACAAGIEATLARLDGVISVQVNSATEKALVEYDPARLDEKTVIGKIRDRGYGVVTPRYDVGITGMSCAACAARIERGSRACPVCWMPMSTWP